MLVEELSRPGVDQESAYATAGKKHFDAIHGIALTREVYREHLAIGGTLHDARGLSRGNVDVGLSDSDLVVRLGCLPLGGRWQDRRQRDGKDNALRVPHADRRPLRLTGSRDPRIAHDDYLALDLS